ncbi:hypothetical protein B0H14DRAFT_3857762 [Mycena olivaceomarginata]|nr:hypothetical protein B0H14DRAFT_3857762 [Mycena olivaceomarginata]
MTFCPEQALQGIASDLYIKISDSNLKALKPTADAIALDYIHSPSFVSAYLQWTVMVGQSYTEPGLADHRVPPPARAVARPDTLPQIVSTKEGGECIKEVFEGSRDWVTTNWSPLCPFKVLKSLEMFPVSLHNITSPSL